MNEKGGGHLSLASSPVLGNGPKDWGFLPEDFMKKNLRRKINDFIFSEAGSVGVKSPLTLGFMGSGLLLAQAMLPSPANAHMICWDAYDCAEDEVCLIWCEKSLGTCTGVWHSECIHPSELED